MLSLLIWKIKLNGDALKPKDNKFNCFYLKGFEICLQNPRSILTIADENRIHRSRDHPFRAKMPLFTLNLLKGSTGKGTVSASVLVLTEWAVVSCTVPVFKSFEKMAAKWDVHYSIFCFQKLSERILNENAVSDQVLRSLRTLCSAFAANFVESAESLKLQENEEETFEISWARLIQFSTSIEKNRHVLKVRLFELFVLKSADF